MAVYETKSAKRYASALFELAVEKGILERIDAELEFALSVLSEREVLRFLGQPQIPRSEKLGFIDKVFEGRVHQILQNAIKIMLLKGRINEFPAVCSYYSFLADQLRGIEEVGIVTAVPLEDSHYDELLAKLSKYTRYGKLRLNRKVKPEILGGIIIELGRDKVMDLSLRTFISDMRRRLVRFHSAS